MSAEGHEAFLEGKDFLELVGPDEVEEHALEIGVRRAVALDEGGVGAPRLLVVLRLLLGPGEVDVAQEEEGVLLEVGPLQDPLLQDLRGLLELELLLLQARPVQGPLRLRGIAGQEGGVLPLREDVLALGRVGLGVAVVPGLHVPDLAGLGEGGLGVGVAVLRDALVARAVEGVRGEGAVDEFPAQPAQGRRAREDEEGGPEDGDDRVGEDVAEAALLRLVGGAGALLVALGDGEAPLEDPPREGGYLLYRRRLDEEPDEAGALGLRAPLVGHRVFHGDAQVEGQAEEAVLEAVHLALVQGHRPEALLHGGLTAAGRGLHDDARRLLALLD